MSYPIKLLQAAHVAPITPDERVLLVQGYYKPKGATEAIKSTRWMLPGGRCETRDRNAIDTCYRELHEELGLTSSAFGDLGIVDCFDWGNPRRRDSIYLARLLERPTLHLQKSEIHNADWFSPEKASKRVFVNDRFKAAVEIAFQRNSAHKIIEGFLSQHHHQSPL